MEFLVRRATVLDSRAIAVLAGQLGYPMEEHIMLDSLRELLEDDNEHVAVAATGSEIIGWIHVGRTVCLESRPFAEIKGLIVDARFHRSGVGRSLAENARRWTMEKGLGKLRVRTQLKRTDAHRFYLRCGFTETKTQKVFDMMVG